MTTRDATAKKIRDIMTTPAQAAKPNDDVRLALQMMLWGGYRHLPVVEGGRLVGMVTDRDIYRAQAHGLMARGTRVREIMHVDIETAAPDESMTEAATRMADAHFGSLPVVEGDRLVGIVTSTDLLAAIGRTVLATARPRGATVSDVMRAKPHCVGVDATIGEAAALMVEHGIRHLPVIDAERRPIGMLSDRDLRAVLGDPATALREGGETVVFDQTSVEQVMTPNPITAYAADSVDDVAASLLHERVGAVPVVDAGERLIGIVSYLDLLRHALAK